MLKFSFILKSHIFKREWPDVQLSHHVIYTSLSNMLKGRCLFILPPCFLSSGNPHCKCSTSQRWKRLARVCATSASSLSNSREDCHTSAARENFGSCCLPLPKKGGGANFWVTSVIPYNSLCQHVSGDADCNQSGVPLLHCTGQVTACIHSTGWSSKSWLSLIHWSGYKYCVYQLSTWSV